MMSHKITFRIPAGLRKRLGDAARRSGRTESDLVRSAIESILPPQRSFGSAYLAAKKAGIIGCAGNGPRDLSTNPRHFDGFGKSW